MKGTALKHTGMAVVTFAAALGLAAGVGGTDHGAVRSEGEATSVFDEVISPSSSDARGTAPATEFDDANSRSVTVVNEAGRFDDANSRSVTVVNEAGRFDDANSRSVTVVNEAGRFDDANSRSVTVYNLSGLSTELTPGVAHGAEFAASDTSHLYRLTVPAGETLWITVDAVSGTASNELYASFADIPDRLISDYASGDPFAPDQSVVIPETQAGTYYILVYADAAPTPPESYTILAELVPFGVTRIEPDAGGNIGSVTVRIEGGKFEENTQFSLIASDESEIFPEELLVENAGIAFATFDLAGAAPGLADMRAVTPDVDEAVAPDLFEILSGGQPELEARIVAPDAVRAWRDFTLQVEYANVGTGDMPAPLLELRSSRPLEVALSPSGTYHTTPVRLLGVNFTGPAGVLPPGASGVITLYVDGTSAGDLQLGLVRLDGSEPVDWDTEGQEVRPPDVTDGLWGMVWDRVKAHVGDTWGDFELAMGNVARRFWLNGEVVYDFRELLAEELALAWEEYPSRISGTLVDSETGQPLANIVVVARRDEDGDGEAEAVLEASSNYDGEFEHEVPAGTYELFAEGYYFDPPVIVEPAPDQDVRAVVLSAIAVPEEEPPPEPSDVPDIAPSLTTDGNGDAHLVWKRRGEIYHATNDGVGWNVDGQVGDAVGVNPRVASDPTDPDGSRVAVVWQDQFDNAAEVRYAVGSPLVPGGAYQWTAPTSLTNDSYADGRPAAAYTPSGELIVVWLKHDAEHITGDDTEVYWSKVTPGALELLELYQGGAELLIEDRGGLESREEYCKSLTLKQGDSVKDWVPLIGGKYGFEVTGEVCGELACDWGISGSVSVSVDFSDNLTGSGSIGAAALWKTDVDKCEWVFDNALLNMQVGASGSIPSREWPIVSVPGLLIEFGSGLSGNVSGTLIWKGANFPSWPDEGYVDLTLGATPFGQITYLAEWVGYARVTGSAQITGRFAPPSTFSIPSWCVSVHGKLYAFCVVDYELEKSWGTCSGYGISWESRHPPDDPRALFKRRSYELDGVPIEEVVVVQVAPWSGTGNAYPGTTVLTDVSADVKTDGAPSLAIGSGGETLVVWTKDSPDPAVALGSSVVVASFDGASWDLPEEVDSTQNFAIAVNIIDPGGTPMIVWSSAPASVVDLQNTAEEILSAYEDTDVYFARRNGGVWSAPAPVAVLPGSDRNVCAAATGPDDAVAAWLHTLDNDTTVYASTWNGSVWSTAVQVSQAAECVALSCAYVQGAPIVVWEVDEDGNPDTTLDRRLYSSVWTGSWSTPDVVPQENQKHADDPAGTPDASRGIPIPELLRDLCCTKCDQDEDCNDNVACTVDTCEEYQESKVCVYTPNDAAVNDGEWCNGEETCARTVGLVPGVPRCTPPESCDEKLDRCPCQSDAQCNNPNNQCIEGECPDGFCQFTPIDCGQSDACTRKGCAPQSSCWSKSVYCPNPGPTVVGSWDPNDKIRPVGFDVDGWVPRGETLFYTILFENKPEATAPAQIVTVTDQLSGDLDWTTFRLQSLGFGDTVVELPTGRAYYQTELDLTDSVGLLVRVEAGIDIETGEVLWSLSSIDPDTGEPPTDPFAGFLPPNDPEVGDGEGFVSFTIVPQADVPTGTVVNNAATIIFDSNPPIDTEDTVNTIDADAPVSAVDPLPTYAFGQVIPLTWSGSDPGGSGLATYTIYVSVDGGLFEQFIGNTTDTEADYLGMVDHSYAFYSRAVDNAGYVEETPTEPDTTTTVLPLPSPPGPAPSPHDAKKHRYLSIDPSTNPLAPTVIKVEIAEMMRCQNDPRRGCLVDLDCRDVCEDEPNTLCPTGPGVCGGGACINSGPCVDVTPDPPVGWLVQEPAQIQTGCLAPGCNPATENCCGDEDWVTRLSDTVYSQDWSAHTLIHISDCGIVPGVTYNVYACDPANINVCSEPLAVGTQATPSGTHLHFGDIAGPPINAGDPYEPPDGFVNVVDVSAWGLTKQNYGTPASPQLHPTMADLHGSGYGVPANYILGLSDQQAIISHGFTWALPWDNPTMLGGVDPSTCPGRLP